LIVKCPGMRFAEGLTLMGFYTVFILIAILLINLSVLMIIEIYYVFSALYTTVFLWILAKREGNTRLKLTSMSLAITLLGGEVSLLLSISYLPGLNVLALALKAIYLILLSISIIELASLKGSNKLRTYGLLTIIGSFLITVPTGVTVIIALILLPLGLFGAGGLLKDLYTEEVPN